MPRLKKPREWWGGTTCSSVPCSDQIRTGPRASRRRYGTSGHDPGAITVSFNGQPVCVNSTGAPGAREVGLSGADIAVQIDLGVGEGTATVWTTDLSHSYVEINSAYSS